jgi:DNA-binding NarL/FixJ family response regulator
MRTSPFVSAARPVPIAEPSSGATVRVLVADDSTAFRSVARQVIELSPGFELAATAATGEEAIAASERVHPDLVLMDVRMPGMGGVKAAEEIASREPGVRVVLISGGLREDVPGASETDLPYLPKSKFGPAVLRELWDVACRT